MPTHAYGGDVDALKEAECKCQAVFPWWDCGGSFVRMERAFSGGEVVRVDCESEGVTIDSVDARADVALSSDFFSLSPGSCELSFTGYSSHTSSFHERWL